MIVESDGDSTRMVIIDEDGIRIQKGEDGEEPFALRWEDEEDYYDDSGSRSKKISATEGYGDFHFGFVQQMRNGNEFITDGLEELDFFRSNDVSIGFGAKTRIGKPTSKFYIKYGLETSWVDFVFRRNNQNALLVKDNGVAEVVNDSTVIMGKSKYKAWYFNVPVMLQLDFSEGGSRDESFTIGVGGYAGICANFKRRLWYDGPVYNDVRETIRDDFFANQFRYGLMGQIGFGSFKITSKYDLNKFFQNGKGPDYQMASISIGWTW